MKILQNLSHEAQNPAPMHSDPRYGREYLAVANERLAILQIQGVWTRCRSGDPAPDRKLFGREVMGAVDASIFLPFHTFGSFLCLSGIVYVRFHVNCDWWRRGCVCGPVFFFSFCFPPSMA